MHIFVPFSGREFGQNGIRGMTDNGQDKLLESQLFPAFEWDEEKRNSNIRKHGIDFSAAISVFDGPHFCSRSDRLDETRFIAVGTVGTIDIAVVYTIRTDRCRVISARKARTNERNAYHQAIRQGQTSRQDGLGPGPEPDR
ncbi:BrnT family toxin [Rhodobium gokarnense]|uniref:BrnT family toxin n=1 Tax=Rhodobium gokarnense TaxID=364296 RepID=UPI0029CAC283|nr:BrnT family toxin [Rhodobium gokarnense]